MKGYSAKDDHKDMLPSYRKNSLSSKVVYNWVEKSVQRIPKFKKSQNKFTVAVVSQLEAKIRAGRQVKIHNAADANEGLCVWPHSIMHNHPQFQNIGAWWFPTGLNLEHKMTDKGLPLEHLCQYKTAGEDIFNRIAIVHESWVHHFQTTSKCTSMPCKHPRSLAISNQKV